MRVSADRLCAAVIFLSLLGNCFSAGISEPKSTPIKKIEIQRATDSWSAGGAPVTGRLVTRARNIRTAIAILEAAIRRTRVDVQICKLVILRVATRNLAYIDSISRSTLSEFRE